MSPAIKFATLENEEISITSEDAKHIALESKTFALILSGKIQEDIFEVPEYGGVAINLAVKYCTKFGEIKHSCAQRSELFEIRCKEVQPWVDDFIIHITKDGLGMVHELLAVSCGLEASRLIDLTCQCIFDELCFKDYRKFREAFAFQFLFPPCFSDNRDIHKVEAVLDGLERPTLEEILTEFKDKIPFTPDELELAESENKSVRVGGSLKYKTNNRSIEELLIKIEYIERRLISFGIFSLWMTSTLSECNIQYIAHVKKFFSDQPNNDIAQIYSTIHEHSTPFEAHSMHRLLGYQRIANPFTNYENIDVIRNAMDKSELVWAWEANKHKKEEEEIVKCRLENWKSHHGDKIFPWLAIFLEDCYQEIQSYLCHLRGWTSPHEVKHKISMLKKWETRDFEYMEDENEDQDKNVESEVQVQVQVQPSVREKTIDDELKELGGDERKELTGEIVSSVRKFQNLAIRMLYGVWDKCRMFGDLEKAMRQIVHLELVIKDEEMLAFICKRKLELYMKASEGGRGTVSFADDKEEFDRIMKETDGKFGDRGPAVEEAKKKYSLYYKKFHDAMVDETKRQRKLLLELQEVVEMEEKLLLEWQEAVEMEESQEEAVEMEESQEEVVEKEESQEEVEMEESLHVEEGRWKRMRTDAATCC